MCKPKAVNSENNLHTADEQTTHDTGRQVEKEKVCGVVLGVERQILRLGP